MIDRAIDPMIREYPAAPGRGLGCEANGKGIYWIDG